MHAVNLPYRRVPASPPASAGWFVSLLQALYAGRGEAQLVVERLRSLVSATGPVQLVFAGKAHPRDEEGKQAIQQIFRVRDALRRH